MSGPRVMERPATYAESLKVMLRLSSPGGGRIRLRRCKSRAWVMTAQGHLETFGVDVRSTPESGRRPLRVKPGIARAEQRVRSTPNTRRENGHAVTSSAGHVWTYMDPARLQHYSAYSGSTATAADVYPAS